MEFSLLETIIEKKTWGFSFFRIKGKFFMGAMLGLYSDKDIIFGEIFFCSFIIK
jgi:hypothetical protein